MAVFFELLDTLSGNFIRDFDTEGEAFGVLAAVGREQGFGSLQSLALVRFDDNQPSLVAQGEDLIAHLKGAPSRGPSEGSHHQATRSEPELSWVVNEYRVEFLYTDRTVARRSLNTTATNYLEACCVA